MFKSLPIIILLLVTKLSWATTTQTDETDLLIRYFDAEKPVATVLWLPSEYGVLEEEKSLAKQLSEQGISVAMPDFFDSYFLPAAPSSLKKIPVDKITTLIHETQSKLPLFIVTSNQSAALAIKTIVSAQQKPLNLLGLVLLNPNLYVETPEVGQTAEYWPETEQVNLPIYVLQAELSPWRWQLAALQKQLATAGSDVFVQVLPAVRDRFYFRPDALPVEKTKTQQLSVQLKAAMVALAPYLTESRKAAEALPSQAAEKTVKAGKKEVDIVDYNGPQNRQLVLEGIDGESYNLEDYKGKVVLLNFWASWCPPCVHEMPSMARLKDQLKGQPFEILAANLAEERPAIETFTQEHPVNFPILLDPKGSAVKEWKVFAYPSSYLIDKKGQIRYALFGGYEWDNPRALQKAKQLLAE